MPRLGLIFKVSLKIANFPLTMDGKEANIFPVPLSSKDRRLDTPNPRLLKKELPEEDAHQAHTATDSVDGKQMASVQATEVKKCTFYWGIL